MKTTAVTMQSPPLSSGEPGRRSLIAAAFIWAISVGIMGVADGLFLVPFEVRLVSVSLALFSLGFILAGCTARPLSIGAGLRALKLGTWTCVGFSVVFGLASLVWLVPAEGTRAVTNPEFLVPASLVAAAGVTCLTLGYRLCPNLAIRAFDRADFALRGAPPAAIGVSAVWTLWLVAVAAQGAAISLGSFGYLVDPSTAFAVSSSVPAVLAILRDLGTLSTLLAAWRHAGQPTTASLSVLVFIVISQVVLGLFGGMKEDVIIQFLAAFIGYGVRRRVKFAPVLVAASLIVVVVVPLITQYRIAVLELPGQRTPVGVYSQVDIGEVLSATQESSVEDSLEEFAQRLSRAGDLAVVMQKTPHPVEYRSPLDLLAGPLLGLIPRSVWPDKPLLDAGRQMSTVYYGLPRQIVTASAMTPYGDLWRHGGLVVVASGMFALGMFYRTIDSRRGCAVADPRLLFLPMLFLPVVVKQEGDYLGLLASIVGVVLAAGLASRLVSFVSSRGVEDANGNR